MTLTEARIVAAVATASSPRVRVPVALCFTSAGTADTPTLLRTSVVWSGTADHDAASPRTIAGDFESLIGAVLDFARHTLPRTFENKYHIPETRFYIAGVEDDILMVPADPRPITSSTMIGRRDEIEVHLRRLLNDAVAAAAANGAEARP